MCAFQPLAIVCLSLVYGGAPYDAPPVEPGFVSLFDAKSIEKEFSVKGDRESWQVVDGVIRAHRGGDRIMSRKQYGDFVLRLDWKITEGGNSGVFIRVPSAGDRQPWVTGFEVQITHAPRDLAHCTGSLYGVVPVTKEPDKRADTWHRFEITCIGGRVIVVADGERSIDARYEDHAEMRKRPRKGYIGLQDYHAERGTVEYRNIRIQELQPDGTPVGFQNLSRDGKGWHKIRTGHGSGGRWTFTGGAWEGEQDPPGSGNGGVLVTDEKFGDFELVLETHPDWGVCSGVFLRSTDRGRCYQIMVDYHGRGNVGGIYGEGTGGFSVRNYDLKDDKGIVVRARDKGVLPLPFAPKDWPKFWRLGGYNEIRARVRGNPPVIDVWLNGAHISHFQDGKKRLDDEGHLGIQVHGGKGWPRGAKVRFRSVAVRELGN